MDGKITNFKDLYAWKEAHKLVLEIYSITKNFPKDELFALTNQMRRAVISISSNIAEGFSRFSKNEKRQFYSIAKGSLTEIDNQLLVAKDVGYITETRYKEIELQITTVGKLITSIQKFVV